MKTYISPKIQVIHIEMEDVIATSILVDRSKSGNQQLSNQMNDWDNIWSNNESTSDDSFW